MDGEFCSRSAENLPLTVFIAMNKDVQMQV